jgi:hypothetical protein
MAMALEIEKQLQLRFVILKVVDPDSTKQKKMPLN